LLLPVSLRRGQGEHEALEVGVNFQPQGEARDVAVAAVAPDEGPFVEFFERRKKTKVSFFQIFFFPSQKVLKKRKTSKKRTHLSAAPFSPAAASGLASSACGFLHTGQPQ